MSNPTALITGVGDGTGAALVRRFTQGGYRVAMIARKKERLKSLESELEGSKAFSLDISDLEGLSRVVDEIKKDMGNPEALVHNAVSATFETFLKGNPEDLEKNFRVNTTSLLYLARALAPEMIQKGKGAIVVTGNTAASRGVPNYALFAPTKAAQRILTESLARELGPQGIHVAYVVIDAAIDTPWTKDQFFSDKPSDFFSQPADIAEEVFRVAHQPESTWSFNVELRPFGEKW